MRKYRLVAKKGEGTFSEVLKAQNVKDGRYHAIKCMKNRFESIDQVNNLREIQALRRLSPHEHVITLEEVLYDQPTGRLALVFELMDANLYELIRGRRHYLNPNLIKSYMWQLMKSLDHMHRKGIFHRDIKPENILIENSTDFGRGLKLADFGSCRGIYSKQPYTEYISTRWYRAPECLLTDGYYGPEMDMWGAGCVMFEITSLYPLFPGSNEVDQINRIHKVLSTPSPEMLQKFKSKGASHISFDFPPQKGIGIPQLVPHASPEAIDLMVKLIKYDATERISAREAMRHPFFRDVRDNEQRRGSQTDIKPGQSNTEENQPGQGVQGGQGKTVKPTRSENSLVDSSNSGAVSGTGVISSNVSDKQNKTLPQPLPSIGIDSQNNTVNKNTQGYNNSGSQQSEVQQAMFASQAKSSGQNLLQNSNQTGGGGGVGASVLPPIMSISSQQQNQNQQGQVSGRSVMAKGISVQQQQQQQQQQQVNQSQAQVQVQAAQKKRKKYRMVGGAGGGVGAQDKGQAPDPQQGLKSYGMAKTGGSMVTDTRNESKLSGVSNGIQGRKASTKF